MTDYHTVNEDDGSMLISVGREISMRIMLALKTNHLNLTRMRL